MSHSYFGEENWKKVGEISSDIKVNFSTEITKKSNFFGIASEVLMKGYKFSRKQKDEKEVTIDVQGAKETPYLLELVHSKIRAAEWANSRANEATTTFMRKQA